MARRPLLRRVADDRRGASAVEFALLAPVMIFIYFCLVEFCQAYMAERRAAHTAAMVADIVAQSDAVTPAGLDDVFAIARAIMRPFPETPLQTRVSSVARQPDGSVRVVWSRGHRIAARAPGSGVSTPPGLLESAGDSLILAETLYAYDSPFDVSLPGFPNMLSGLTTFRRDYYLRPRTVDRVRCDAC